MSTNEEAKRQWSMNIEVLEDGSRKLNVEGQPTVGEMLSEFNFMIENLRAELVAQKILAAGKKAPQQPQLWRPGQ